MEVMSSRHPVRHSASWYKGYAEGYREGLASMLILVATQLIGEPGKQHRRALAKITSPDELKSLGLRLFKVESWEELLAD